MPKAEDVIKKGSKEVDPKLSKMVMRVFVAIVILFAVGMIAFTFYAQTKLTDSSSEQLNSNYTYNK